MFDHDGVVVDSFAVFGTAFAAACVEAGIPGVRTPADVVGLFAGNIYESLRTAGADVGQSRRAVCAAAEALERELPRLRPFPGMTDLLRSLSAVHDVVIVTSNTEGLVKRFLARHGLGEGVAVAGAESGRSKVDKIRALIARHPGQDVYWFVGDTEGDMREAGLAGATPVGVAWGWHDPARLRAAGARCVAGSAGELHRLLAPEDVAG
jgi:phosphoglycolate phosphatase